MVVAWFDMVVTWFDMVVAAFDREMAGFDRAVGVDGVDRTVTGVAVVDRAMATG